MYTREKFGKELKGKIRNRHDKIEIGSWIFSMYWKHLQLIDDDEFEDILLSLGMMELGSEFAYSYERLDEIADDLIAGREVNLDY